MQKKKILYLDILRILASFAVIAIHVSTQNFDSYSVDTYEWGAFNVFDSLSRWAVPVFCMISGTLFLNKDKKIKTLSLYTKNISRMLIAYFVWSTFYAVFNYDVDVIGKTEFIKKIFLGNYHMWYILLIVGFYALVPVLRRISSSRATTQYFILISLVVTFLIPAVALIPNFEWVKTNANRAFLNLPLGYTPYFFIGYYIVKYDIAKWLKKLIYILGPLAFAGTILGTLVISQLKGKFYSEFYQYDSFTVLFQSLFVFVAVKELFENVNPSEKAEKFVSSISKHTFGVYLVHTFIIFELNELFGINSVTVNPYIAIPAVIFITYLVSEIISAILNHIPLVKKYLV